MRFTDASSLLATATAAILAATTPLPFNGSIATSNIFAAAAPGECPGGAKPDGNGVCPNPDMNDDDDDDDDDESSSDDGDSEGVTRSGNPNAHREEGEDKPPTTCESYLKLAGFRDAVYETKSFYQEVAWTENANKPDVCMSLDDILQICHSYRPHYHEPYVHFPAAYLKDMKRIVFIGGGDAMLLHESLKYPNVELVLGLELDQKVVRESLKFFHTQPHFEDPRVQWWFGDAAKSLSLIPREWFGTFDLVMVDLSETAMSISVTDDLDIFGALSLLMKPEGIFVKNELYYGQMSRLFDHSVFVYMTDYPILCDQDWAMGSNHHDFLHPQIEDGHMERDGVSTFEYRPLEDEDEHYKLIKDYSHNDARKQGKCDEWDKLQREGEPEKKDPVKPTRSAGAMMVVEVEGVTNMSGFENKLEELLKGLDLNPLAPGVVMHTAAVGDVSQGLFIGMEEGYVDAHYYPSKSHVGLEVTLWSKIYKHDEIRKALLVALGSPETAYSSYRVIHGGMLGAQNWKEDVEAVGPVKRTLRECDPAKKAAEPQIGSGPMSSEVFATAVTSSLQMLPKKMDKVVAVVCGIAGTNPCNIVKTLQKHSKVDKVVALWACPSDGNKKKHPNNDGDDEVSNIYVCSTKDLKRSAKIEEGYSAVVIDPESDEDFTSGMNDEFCKKRDAGQHVLMRDQVSIMASLANDAETVFYASCVKNLIKHMVRSSRIIIDGTAQFGLIGTNNPGFVRRVVGIQEAIAKKTGLRTVIEKMVGGPVEQQKQYDPEHYPPNAYDERDALKQYTNQMPLASQSLYNIDVEEADIKKMSIKGVQDALAAVLNANPKFAEAKRVDFSTAMGDGAVSVAIMSSAHVIVTWDGAGRVSINTLTLGEQYQPEDDEVEVPDMVLTGHMDEIVEVFLGKLPVNAKVAVREQMPRGSNRVVNFKKDINAIPNCTDHFVMCQEFAREGECDDEEEQPWMHKYCSLSCGTCDKMTMGGPQAKAQ
mmetsp:Transcript_19521/g.35395  ORF Transcript_19521/g.35395 Transcript_19521/m.35395 type:complete len:986 (-) Transcript_19521:61-3018(-)|eukprot:CAMPEP_0196142206 /NCGR_PEP_ID=MMETSP0910-20130528/11295_1 /TAXON_ID=49265 /ORGANISM="Thalassiosira rotula, Strain GSO102" /LENGTH=985 /DNA_ID=CAMNT_0041403489 /DNA_START=79 /DNA_END=3036 /DNA_ORIENTATION=+